MTVYTTPLVIICWGLEIYRPGGILWGCDNKGGVIAAATSESCCHIPGIQEVGDVTVTGVIAAVSSFSPPYLRKAERSVI